MCAISNSRISFMRRQLLKEKYDELSQRHPGLIKVSPERVKQLQEPLEEVRDISGVKYYIITLAALFTLATAPALVANYYDLCIVWEGPLFELLNAKEYLSTHQYIHVSLFFLVIAIPLYTLWLPFADFYRRKIHSISQTLSLKALFKNSTFNKFPILQPPRLSHSKESKTFFFYIYILVLNYSAAIIIFLYLISFNLLSAEKLHLILLVWLMLPSPIFALAPAFLFLVSVGATLSLLPMQLASTRYIRMLPSRIVLQLLLLLDATDKLKDENDLIAHENQLPAKILRISTLISQLHLMNRSTSLATQQIKDKFINAAKAFESLIPYAALPKPGSLAQLRRHTIRTANIFLTGNLGNLDEVPYTKGDSACRSVGIVKKSLSIVGLLAYLLIPIALWAFAADHWTLKLDDASKTLLTVLYSLWAVTGIVSFSGMFAIEVKELLISMLRQKFKE